MAVSYNTFWPVNSLQLIFVAGPPGFGFWSRCTIRKQLGDGQYLVEQIMEGGWRNGVVEEKAIWDIVAPDPSYILYSPKHWGPMSYPRTSSSLSPPESDDSDDAFWFRQRG